MVYISLLLIFILQAVNVSSRVTGLYDVFHGARFVNEPYTGNQFCAHLCNETKKSDFRVDEKNLIVFVKLIGMKTSSKLGFEGSIPCEEEVQLWPQLLVRLD